MNTLPINLPDDLTAHLQAQIAAGHYATPSDYIQALIQQDQAYKAHVETRLLEALDSPASPLTPDDWETVRATVRQNLSQSTHRA